MRSTVRAGVVLMAASSLAANCKSAGVKVPAAGADRAPTITLNNIVLAGSANGWATDRAREERALP